MTGNGTQAAADLISTVIGHRAEAVSFTAAPQVEVLAREAAAQDLTAPLLDAFNSGNVVAACIGPVCAEGARAAGIETPLVPEHPRLGSLTNASAGYLAQRHSETTALVRRRSRPEAPGSGVAIATTGLFAVTSGALPQAGAPPKAVTAPSASTM